MQIPFKVLEAITTYPQGQYLSDELFNDKATPEEVDPAMRILYDIAQSRELIIEVEKGEEGKTRYRWFRADIAVRYTVMGEQLIQKERSREW